MSSLTIKDKKPYAIRKALVLPVAIKMAKIIHRRQYDKKFKCISMLKKSELPYAKLWVTIYLKCNENDVLWVCAVSTVTMLEAT